MSAGESSTVSVDQVLARLDGTIAQLADGTAPLDELIAAHLLAAGLVSEAEGRLEALAARADRLAAALKE